MKIRCPQCKAKYSTGVEEIPEKGQKFQCASCGHVFRVQKKSQNIDEALSSLKGRLNAWDPHLDSAEEDPFTQEGLLSAGASSSLESVGVDFDIFAEESGSKTIQAEDSGEGFEMPGTKNGGLKGLVEEITEGGEEVADELSEDMIDSLLEEVESGDISLGGEADIEMPESETHLEDEGLGGLEGLEESFEELLGEDSAVEEGTLRGEAHQKSEEKDDIASEMDNVFDNLMGGGEEDASPPEVSAEGADSLEEFSFDESPPEEASPPESVDLGADFDEMFGEEAVAEGAEDDEKTGAVEADAMGVVPEESPPSSSEDTAPLPAGSALEDLDSAFGEMFGEDSGIPSPSSTEEESSVTEGGVAASEEDLLDSLMQEAEAGGMEDAETQMITTPPPPGTEAPESADKGMSEEDLWASALQEQKAMEQGEDETTKAAEVVAPAADEDTGPGGDLVSQGDLDQLFAEASGGEDESTGQAQTADWGGSMDSSVSAGKTEIINQSELDNLWNQALAEQSETGQEEKGGDVEDKPESTGIVSQEELDGLFSGVGKEDKELQGEDQEPSEDLTAQTEMMEVKEDKTAAMPGEESEGEAGGGEGEHEGEEEFEFDEELLSDKKKKSFKEKISLAYITGILPEGKKRYVIFSLVGVLLLGGIGTGGYFGYRHYSQSKMAGTKIEEKKVQEAKAEKPAAEKVAKLRDEAEETAKTKEKPIQDATVTGEPVKEEAPAPAPMAQVQPQIPVSEKSALELGLIMPIQFSPTEMKVLQANFVFETRDHESYEHLKFYLPIYQELMEKIANEFFNESFYNEIHYAKDKLKDKLMETFNKEMKRESITRVEVKDFIIDIKEEKKKTEEKKEGAPEGEKPEEEKGEGLKET